MVLLLRCTGAALTSLGSAGFRDFLGFFSRSKTTASFSLGFGPGFLRGCPDAVSPRGAGDVPAPTAPPAPAEARTAEFGVPCSGEWGGELRLPGEDASLTSMASAGREVLQAQSGASTRHGVQTWMQQRFKDNAGRIAKEDGRSAKRVGRCGAAAGCAESTPKTPWQRMGSGEGGGEHQKSGRKRASGCREGEKKGQGTEWNTSSWCLARA